MRPLGVAAGMALVLGMSSLAFTPESPAMDGLTALRAGEVDAARAKFHHDGNVLRVAECLILKDEIDSAALLCEPLDTPVSLRLRAIIARKRGDHTAAGALWVQAAERGDEVAKAVIASGGAASD